MKQLNKDTDLTQIIKTARVFEKNNKLHIDYILHDKYVIKAIGRIRFSLGIDDIEIKDNSGMAVSESPALSLRVFPNPATELVKISGIKNIDNVRVFDMTGKIVKEVKSQEINIKDLPNGEYIINVYLDKNVISKKLIKK